MPLQPNLDALQHFLVRSAVPIFYDLDSDAAEARGTGTFLDLGDHLFLVTAAHVVEGCDVNQLSSPWRRNGKLSKPVTWGPGGIWRSRSSDGFDVAVAEIAHPEAAAEFRLAYHCLTLDQIAMPAAGSTHILAGYPSEFTKAIGDRVDQTPFIYYSGMLPEAPADAANVNDRDLFFKLERKGKVISGDAGDTPDLHGVSGCVVWQLGSCDGLWTPQRSLRAIGVQTSAKADAWFRATNWLSVVPVLAHFDRRAAFKLGFALVGLGPAVELLREAGYEVVPTPKSVWRPSERFFGSRPRST